MRNLLSFLSFLSLTLLVSACTTTVVAPTAPSRATSAAELVDETVALVETDPEDGSTRAYCTGVWVDQDTILTAAHCVAVDPFAAMLGMAPDGVEFLTHGDLFIGDAGSEVRYPKSHTAAVVKVDEAHDLALLRTKDAPAHRSATLSKGPITQGDFTQSMGHSKGLWWSYSTGDVAAIRFTADLGTPPMTWIQATAPISPGNSGGGLYDARGDLIGICSRGISSGRAQNLNFFVHRDHIAAFLGSK